MSAKNKPKTKKGGRVKRQAVESDDGWTMITHGVAGMNMREKGKKGKEKEKEVAGAVPMRNVEGLTSAKLKEEFENLQEKWEGTAVSTQIATFMASRTWDVNDAVCIGIGSFARDWENRWRSMWQLVLFVAVAKLCGGDIKMFVQDPAFTPLDVEFLQLLKITTLDAGIEAHISQRAFVFSPFVDWFILLPVFLQGKDSVLYVGNEILDDYAAFAQTRDKKEKLEECNGIGTAFLAGKDKVKLVDFELHAHALNGMVIYSTRESPA
jgi:hypothetical protein